jgi:hypothetical protein
MWVLLPEFPLDTEKQWYVLYEYIFYNKRDSGLYVLQVMRRGRMRRKNCNAVKSRCVICGEISIDQNFYLAE